MDGETIGACVTGSLILDTATKLSRVLPTRIIKCETGSFPTASFLNPSDLMAAAPTPNLTTPAQTGNRDYLTPLPLELLLLITSHLSPKLTERPTILWRHDTKPGQFISHADLLALLCTCKALHNIFAPELFKIVLAAKNEDPLDFAVRKAHLGLAMRLLEEGHVEATEERLMKWIGRADTYTGVSRSW